MGRKYIDDLEIETIYDSTKDDDRQEKWKQEQELYGFDERDTWNLDYTMVTLLYERLKMYDKINNVDTKYHTYTIGRKEETVQYWIEKMIENCEIVIKDEVNDKDTLEQYKEKEKIKHEKHKEIWEIWSQVFPSIWW